MFVIKRNQVIVTALAVMIAVAGYLNFTESNLGESGKTAVMLTEEGDASTALLPDGDIETLADNAPEADENMDVAATNATMDPITAEVTGGAQGAEVAVSEGDATVAVSETDDTGAAVFVNAQADTTTYFVQAKLDREQARSKEKDILTEMINNDNIDKEQKTACADSMLEIQKRIEKETAAEAMIEAKGFNEAYVRIDDETVDVVVEKEALSEAETAQIMDIVKRKTGIAEDKVRISPLKK